MFDKSDQESNRTERETYLDTTSSNVDRDILIGFGLFAVGLCINGVPGVLLGIGITAYFLITLLGNAPSKEQGYERSRTVASSQIRSTINAPITTEPTIADKIKSIHSQNDFKCPACGATVLPTDIKCKHCGSILIATVDLPRPAKWGEVEVGQSVRLKHPEKGELALSIIYRVYYGELWQAQMKPDVPWTLTSNYYVGLGLENGNFLSNWQSRFYLLEAAVPLVDKDINLIFAKPAREFAASNQSKNVSFSYNKSVWTIEDIGRFRIEWTDGEGAKADPGAIGRFIHAKSGSQILVLEDYQSNPAGAGGSDHLRMGYEIEQDNIHI